MANEKTFPLSLNVNLQNIPSSVFTIEESLGEGGYGTVYKGFWHGIEVAVKQLHLQTLSKNLLADFERETKLMAQAQFPSIVRLYGVCLEPGHYAMIMEYLPKGSLYEVLHNAEEPLPWNPVRWNIALDISKGLSYLHSQQIIHRDLKSPNVLLDNYYHAKISDFGLSTVKFETSKIENEIESPRQKRLIGSTRWLAPELFKPGITANKASDMFSYGMVLWEIASRKVPFQEASNEQLVISWIKEDTRETIPLDCPKEYESIIKTCWATPDKRPSADKILSILQQSSAVLETENKLTQKKSKIWHFDGEIERKKIQKSHKKNASNMPYTLLEVSDKDKQKVIKFYQHHPMNGYEIKSIKAIDNPAMTKEFELYLGKLQQKENNPAFAPNWMNEESHQGKKAWRKKTSELFESMAKPYIDSEYPAVKLLPLWHGTRPEILDSLFRIGYANLATTDTGFFGKGIYSAGEAEYSYRVYSHGALILNWVACFSAYPVIEGDMEKLQEKGNYANYDAHFVPVIPASPLPFEKNYYPTGPRQLHQYTEMVVFQSSACLPKYLVELQIISLQSLSEAFFKQKGLLRELATKADHVHISSQFDQSVQFIFTLPKGVFWNKWEEEIMHIWHYLRNQAGIKSVKHYKMPDDKTQILMLTLAPELVLALEKYLSQECPQKKLVSLLLIEKCICLRQYQQSSQSQSAFFKPPYADNQAKLVICIQMGNLNKINELIEAGTPLINYRDDKHNTYLHLIAKTSRIILVQSFLTKGLKVDALNNFGDTPLHYACSIENLSDDPEGTMAKDLIKAGSPIDTQNKQLQTPLMVAAHWGHLKAIKVLLKSGANALLKDQEGKTALELARKSPPQNAKQIITLLEKYEKKAQKSLKKSFFKT